MQRDATTLRLTLFSKLLLVLFITVIILILTRPAWSSFLPSKEPDEYSEFLDETADFIINNLKENQTGIIHPLKPYDDEKKMFGTLIAEDIYMRTKEKDSTKLWISNQIDLLETYASTNISHDTVSTPPPELLISGKYAVLETELKIWISILEINSGELIRKTEKVIPLDSEIKSLAK